MPLSRRYASPTTTRYIDSECRRVAYVPCGTTPLAGRLAAIVSPRGLSYADGTDLAGWDHAVPPLLLMLETALGMFVEVVTVDYTLASKVPHLAAFAERAEPLSALKRLPHLGASL